ncbi:hypothetical protein [Burkholderia cepacia]|uniref:hypothetical protein n=1 Tax=Burkholderia cepacia TaxID=292 RepID=UPI00041B5772|nr:hypothetical protein [Burkholderia cepacia]MCA8465252.1 hypothetical protein [Burkholderia cepacia]MDN7613654.1 hypothetical protein [Burkholderia cepacia]MDN7762067.1 hypothetical protein [Burkholderia cepacia]QCY08238.1 hypothetical protein EJ998_34945 [Burkholderia cepacia ATCC 25416]
MASTRKNTGNVSRGKPALEHHLTSLKRILTLGDARMLERLAASLIGSLIGVRLAVSDSGFQFGADAGTAGSQGRHIRIESKRYADGTSLNKRELQGEVDDALKRNPLLELWILVCTRRADEGLRETLNGKADSEGLPIAVIDWDDQSGGIPELAALCAVDPELVKRFYGKPASDAALAIHEAAQPVIGMIRRELEPWKIGFDSVREAAAQRIVSIWNNATESTALFAQNAAGGAADIFITRKTVLDQLDNWWAKPSYQRAIAHGSEGVGKTWTILHWIVRELERLPIVLAIPSSAIRRLKGLSNGTLQEFLGDELYDLTRSRNRVYWEQRVRRLLSRPAEEGPALLLTLDGLNQEPSFEWVRLLQILQGETFHTSVRTLVSVQTHFLENRLQGLRSAPNTSVRIGIEPYSDIPGGELDELLIAHSIPRTELSADLVRLACIPRLFPLVVRFREEASFKGGVTVNRLLWAYGRDELGMREGRSFSELEWTQWLVAQANKYLEQIGSTGADLARLAEQFSYTADELASSAQVSARSVDDNYRRLSEIISGAWMEEVPGRLGVHRPKESTIHLALAAALLTKLEEASANGHDVTAALEEWLDPIASTSASPDILSAAISVLVARGAAIMQDVTTPVLFALLQSQNANDEHRNEVVDLAPALAVPLLDVTEMSSGRAMASARSWAVQALRLITPAGGTVWNAVLDRLVEWVARVPCPSPEERIRDKDASAMLSRHLVHLIGTDEAGIHPVMGIPLRLQHKRFDDLRELVPILLQGKALHSAERVFAATCVVHHVDMLGSDFWLAMRWLVLLNQVDRDEVVRMLVRISDAALHVVTEKGVHKDFQQQIAAFLRWLAGTETSEAEASAIQDRLPGNFEYQRDYLANPSQSFYALEYRHTLQVLGNSTLPVLRRAERTARYWAAPNLNVPKSFVDALAETANALDVSLLRTGMTSTIEDHNFDTLVGVLGRFTPDALGALVTRFLRQLAERTDQARHWAGLQAPDHVLLVDDAAANAASMLRHKQPTVLHKDEQFVAARLVHLELLPLDVRSQLDLLAEAEGVPISLTLRYTLKPADSGTLSRFIEDRGVENQRVIEVVFASLGFHPVPLPESEVERLANVALALEHEVLRNVAFIGLSTSNPASFGRVLLQNGWCFKASQTVFEQEYGSAAVLAAAKERSLISLAGLVAPWSLLRAALERGAAEEDVKVAAQALDATLSASQHLDIGVLDSDVTIDVSDAIARLSLHARQNEENVQSLAEMFDFKKREARERAARSNTLAQLERARTAGANLYSILFPTVQARLLVKSASAEVDAWLDGMEELTVDFVRRVNQAGGLFVALCEALMEVAPIRGIALWRALKRSLRVKFTGIAGVDDLMHMPFRVDGGPAINQFRDELYQLQGNATTADYVETVVCALANGRRDWLDSRILADENSTEDWRRKRAILLRGLTDHVAVDELEWPEGDLNEGWGQVKREAQFWRNRSAFSRYWWQEFVSASSAEAAYAAWQVLLTCVDRKIWIWIDQDFASLDESDLLSRRKLLHLQLSRRALERAVNDGEKKAGNNATESLMSWKAPNHWLDLSVVQG